jgi:hypothetical protein
MKSCEIETGKMRTSNIQKPTSNIQVKKPLLTWMLVVGCWMLDVRFSFFLLFILLQGCCPPPPPAHVDYIGPTDPMDVVIADINRNASRIPTLWTYVDFTASFVDPKKQTTQTIKGDGVLMYARPKSLLINGDKDIAGQMFQIGSNDDEFWLRIRTNDGFTFYQGHYNQLGKPGSKPIPIRPDRILEVLGIGMYRNNFLQMPVPVMRFDNAADAYIFDINEPVEDRWETREEIWYDRRTKMPTKVFLYEANGRVALKAILSQPTGVQIPDMPPPQWPQIARHYELTLPDTGSSITLDLLNDPEIRHPGKQDLYFPNPNSFVRPDPDDGDKVISVDP